jgi:hypothetical protein
LHAKKLGFLLSMAPVASAILATRIQEVDVPIWHRFAVRNRVNPLTRCTCKANSSKAILAQHANQTGRLRYE